MLTGVHFLLTYMCNLECDHCFVYSKPNAKGTFTLIQIKRALEECKKVETIEWIYFEGGEPFLFYPLMLEGIKIAKEMGFRVGVVTNAYWATSEEDAELWLKPLHKLGVSDVSISDDPFHYEEDSPAKRASVSAKRLNMSTGKISIDKPTVEKNQAKGAIVVDGGAMLRGRAVEKLIKELPTQKWEKFTECPYEDLRDPKRVHLDSYGNVHICQGLSMDNIWKVSFSQLVKNYNADKHPICGPLLKGGPALLAKEYGVLHEDEYADACHFCYLVRLALIERFPEYLTPKQVYGLE